MRNLVDNAIRYTPSGGSVKVKLDRQLKTKTLTVTDSGPGIPKELRKRVFERFYRVLGNKAPGSGLGLAIVKQIVTLHNAKIYLNTPPSGKGLEIKIVFH